MPNGGSDLHVFLEFGDHLGNATVIVDKDTSQLVEYATYLPYGATETDYRPAAWLGFREEHRFTGKEEDIEVGLTYFGARYFSPYLARFVSPDPLTIHALGADLNPYAYVSGSVYNQVDPLGLDGKEEQPAATGANGGATYTGGTNTGGGPAAGGDRCATEICPVDSSADRSTGNQSNNQWRPSLSPFTGATPVSSARLLGFGASGAPGGGGPSRDPVSSSPRSASEPDLLGYDNPHMAAWAAGMMYNKVSMSMNREIGGLIYELDDKFYFTRGIYSVSTGASEAPVLQADMLVPYGAKVVGAYHTHGAWLATRDVAAGVVQKPFSPLEYSPPPDPLTPPEERLHGLRNDYILAFRLAPYLGVANVFLSVSTPSGHFGIITNQSLPGPATYFYNAGFLQKPAEFLAPVPVGPGQAIQPHEPSFAHTRNTIDGRVFPIQ